MVSICHIVGMETRSSPARPDLVTFAREMIEAGAVPPGLGPWAGLDPCMVSKADLFELAQQLGFDRWLRRKRRRDREPEAHTTDDSLSEAGAATAASVAEVTEAPRDPITLEPVEPPVFEFTRPGGTHQVFGVQPLVSYLLACGNFVDPTSRVPFTEDDLAQLDHLAADAGLGLPSLVEAKKCRGDDYKAERELRDQITGIERLMGNEVGRMVEMLDQIDPANAPQFSEELLTTVLPQFGNNIANLAYLDAFACTSNLDGIVAFLRGPADRPNRNPYCFRTAFEVFCTHLKEQVVHASPAAMSRSGDNASTGSGAADNDSDDGPGVGDIAARIGISTRIRIPQGILSVSDATDEAMSRLRLPEVY